MSAIQVSILLNLVTTVMYLRCMCWTMTHRPHPKDTFSFCMALRPSQGVCSNGAAEMKLTYITQLEILLLIYSLPKCIIIIHLLPQMSNVKK